MIEPIVITREDCQPCKALKRWLTKNGIQYTELDADYSDEAAPLIAQYRIRTVPATIYGGQVVRGFAPTLLTELLA